MNPKAATLMACAWPLLLGAPSEGCFGLAGSCWPGSLECGFRVQGLGFRGSGVVGRVGFRGHGVLEFRVYRM